MNKPPQSSDDDFELDPRRRLGISTSTEEDVDPAVTKRKVRRDRIAIIGAVVGLLFFFFMMFTDSIMNFQCRPWDFVTFQCNRFDADFKPWD